MPNRDEVFLRSYVSICETCHGSGVTSRTFETESEMMSWLNDHNSIEEKCKDCNGSGRWQIMMYRKPFGPERKQDKMATFET